MKPVSAILTAMALAALAGCSSSHKTTLQTNEGPATITTSQDRKDVTVQTSEGTTSIGRHVDAAKLGAPIYPGAESNQQGSISSTNAQAATVIAAFKTADSFDRVYDFYRQQLPAGSERMKVAGGNGSVATFQIGSPKTADEVSVQVSSDKPSETDILITHVTRKT